MSATLASLLACAALAAPAPFDEPTGDLKTLQGTWEATIRGPQGRTAEISFAVEDTTFTMTISMPGQGEERQMKGEIKLDEKADPKQIDLTPKEFKPDTAGPRDREPMKGIYKLEGETFTLCPPSGPDNDRPTEFAEDAGDGPPKLIKFTRKKDEAKPADK